MITGKVQAEDKFAEYRQAVAGASVKALRTASGLVKRSAAQLAPVGKPHRTSPRTYPSGRSYTGEKTIKQSIYSKVRRLRYHDTTYRAWVGASVGYSLFQEYGYKTRGGGSVPARAFLRRALALNRSRIIPILTGEVSRETSRIRVKGGQVSISAR